MAFDIFEVNPFRLDLSDDARDLGPKVTRVVFAFSAAGIGERLAWISGREDMNAAAPLFAIKGFEIVPYRSLIQGRVRHPCHESGRCVHFPLDVTHSSIAGLCDGKAEVEASIACAKGKPGKGLLSVAASEGM
jgi:hypothetical protein